MSFLCAAIKGRLHCIAMRKGTLEREIYATQVKSYIGIEVMYVTDCRTWR